MLMECLDYSDEERELHRLIAPIVARKNAAAEGSAQRLMAVRQLQGLRNTREEAGPIIESLDRDAWGSY